MSHVLTTYKRPSISDLIRSAPSFEALSSLRDSVSRGFEQGKIAAQERTIVDWHQAIFERLCSLILTAPTAGAACHLYNSTLRWYSDDTIRGTLAALTRQRAAAL